jgi:hypothetical protein
MEYTRKESLRINNQIQILMEQINEKIAQMESADKVRRLEIAREISQKMAEMKELRDSWGKRLNTYIEIGSIPLIKKRAK